MLLFTIPVSQGKEGVKHFRGIHGELLLLLLNLLHCVHYPMTLEHVQVMDNTLISHVSMISWDITYNIPLSCNTWIQPLQRVSSRAHPAPFDDYKPQRTSCEFLTCMETLHNPLSSHITMISSYIIQYKVIMIS